MSTEETIKQGDIFPLDFQVSADLTGATTRLLARDRSLRRTYVTQPIELPHTLTNRALGKGRYDADGTLAIADYSIELEATWPDGTKITFPGGDPDEGDGTRYALLHIVPGL